MKIAMLGHKRVPSREGGIEVVVEELATRMVEMGNQVTCYNRAGHHVSGKKFDKTKLKEYKGVRLKTVLSIHKKGLEAATSSFFSTLCATFQGYDVIHFHAEGSCAFLWLPKLFHKKCVVTIHGLDWKREKWGNGFGSKYIHFAEKIAVRYANEIIVLSKNTQEYFQENFGRKTALIPNGVSLPSVLGAKLISEKFGLEKDSYILFLGRVVLEKGITYLIEAYKNLKTDKKLVIAGGSSDTDEFYAQLQRVAPDNVLFTGFVEGELLKELYSNSYVYVLPSDLEGMPLSLLEAMSYGNCCLVSDIPECADVVEDRAVLFKHSDIDDLCEKLQYLVDSSGIVQQYKNQAADFICKKYNWDDVTQQTLQLYKGA